MNLDDLTYGQLKEIAAKFGGAAAQSATGAPIPVLVCTDKRGVVFGYTSDPQAKELTLTKARMCLYWSSDVGGVFGLAEKGPTENCKISATAPSVTLAGITAVFSVDSTAETAWNNAPVQGR
ncbi:MAG TPA: hypothetical protein VMT20_15150 [Terriglobia bacterium]|nr:hypothetical protein [Terriglobia bacterium]